MDAPGTAILYSWGRTGFEHMYCKHVLFPLSCKHTLFLHLSGLFSFIRTVFILSGLFSFYQDCFHFIRTVFG